jgi:hypothetical protein
MPKRYPYFGLFAIKLDKKTPEERLLQVENKIRKLGHVVVDSNEILRDKTDVIFGKINFPNRKWVYVYKTDFRLYFLDRDIETFVDTLYHDLELQSHEQMYICHSLIDTTEEFLGFLYKSPAKTDD